MSLEKNIERIADALEAIAKTIGAGTLSGEKNAAAPRAGHQAAQQISGQPPVQQPAPGSWPAQPPIQGSGQPPRMQQQAPQGGQVPVSLPAGTGMPWQGAGSSPAAPGNIPPQQPGTLFQQPAGSGKVPTTAAAQQYTFDQLAVATANLASAGKDVFTVLGRFGVNMLMDLPPEKYGEYAAALREAGGVI